MKKEQLKALEKVVHGPGNDGHKEMQRVYFTEDHVYATDGRQIYRLVNDAGDRGSQSSDIPYPCAQLDRYLEDAGIGKRYVAVNTEVLGRKSGMELCRIGQNWYDVKKVRSALMILGSDVTAWEDSMQPMRGLHLESGEGVGVILPVRLIGEKELN